MPMSVLSSIAVHMCVSVCVHVTYFPQANERQEWLLSAFSVKKKHSQSNNQTKTIKTIKTCLQCTTVQCTTVMTDFHLLIFSATWGQQ